MLKIKNTIRWGRDFFFFFFGSQKLTLSHSLSWKNEMAEALKIWFCTLGAFSKWPKQAWRISSLSFSAQPTSSPFLFVFMLAHNTQLPHCMHLMKFKLVTLARLKQKASSCFLYTLHGIQKLKGLLEQALMAWARGLNCF